MIGCEGHGVRLCSVDLAAVLVMILTGRLRSSMAGRSTVSPSGEKAVMVKGKSGSFCGAVSSRYATPELKGGYGIQYH